MGMFDSVIIYMSCPKCKKMKSLDFQTKDLACAMHTYYPLDKDWDTSPLFGKECRKRLPECPKFPFDKEHTVWKNQAERIEAAAMLESPFDKQLNVRVYASCRNCEEWIEGTIAVVDGKMRLPLILLKEEISDEVQS